MIPAPWPRLPGDAPAPARVGRRSHDLGHPPFGHIGEEALDRCLSERFGQAFRHNEHSLRVVDVLERDGRGLNLSMPVREGILHHSWHAEPPSTLEGAIVRAVRGAFDHGARELFRYLTGMWPGEKKPEPS